MKNLPKRWEIPTLPAVSTEVDIVSLCAKAVIKNVVLNDSQPEFSSFRFLKVSSVNTSDFLPDSANPRFERHDELNLFRTGPEKAFGRFNSRENPTELRRRAFRNPPTSEQPPWKGNTPTVPYSWTGSDTYGT